MAEPEVVIVGRIRRAHGIRGEMVVETITDEPAAVFAAGRRVFMSTAHGELPPDPAELRMEAVRSFKDDLLLIRFDGVNGRDDIERLRDRFLFVPFSEVAPPAPGEAYVHELTGMRVELASGEQVGEVRDVFELPQGYVVEVAREKGSVMIPLQPAFLVEIEREGRRIVVTLPDGMLD
jgi:16S rRNA processing protein RimM